MARPLRLEFSGIFYDVTARGFSRNPYGGHGENGDVVGECPACG